MNISQNGLEFIASFEGFADHLYNDPSPAGHCTIGIGHKLHDGNCDGRANEQPYQNGITKAQALDLLEDDVVSRVATVNEAVTVPLNQNQFDALVSFVFNLGAGAFRAAYFLVKLNQGDYAAVPPGLMLYVHADGVRLEGLVRRRRAEGDLWRTPVEEEEELSSREYKELKHDVDNLYAGLGWVGGLVRGAYNAIDYLSKIVVELNRRTK